MVSRVWKDILKKRRTDIGFPLIFCYKDKQKNRDFQIYLYATN